MKHLIGKQILDFKVSPDADAFNLQHQVSQLYWGRIVAEMESLFDQLTNEHEVVRIDRLEVDLGQLTEERLLEGKFIALLRQQLEDQLRELLRGQGSSRVVAVSANYSLFEQWLFFLRTGRLPWSSLKLPANWSNSILATIGENIRAAAELQQLLRAQPLALQRLLVQHPIPFLKSLVELYTGKKQTALIAVDQELQQLPEVYWQEARAGGSVKRSQRQIGLLFWKEVLEIALVLERKVDAQALIRRFLNSHFSIRTLQEIRIQEKERDYPGLFKALRDQSGTVPEQSPSENRPVQATPAAKDTPPQGTDRDLSEPAAESDSKPETGGQAPTTAGGQDSAPADESDAKGKSPPAGESPSEAAYPFENDLREAYLQDRATLGKEELFLQNAGVVILHLFLTSIFQKLGYLEDQAFKDETARHRAIHLVHYLATGESEVPEYSLLLPKILCGLPLGIPLDHTLQVSPKEKEEADALLEAVISHWTALKKTSPDGLREGFLQRDGKLHYDAGGWLLRVENKTLDMLLNQLPWGIGVIKLPWMLDLVRVEWG